LALVLVLVGIGLLVAWARVGDPRSNSPLYVDCATVDCPEREIERPASRYAPTFAIAGLAVIALGAGIIVDDQAAIRSHSN
jgi:hypothetical protein